MCGVLFWFLGVASPRGVLENPGCFYWFLVKGFFRATESGVIKKLCGRLERGGQKAVIIGCFCVVLWLFCFFLCCGSWVCSRRFFSGWVLIVLTFFFGKNGYVDCCLYFGFFCGGSYYFVDWVFP